jgi:hypothetical protein
MRNVQAIERKGPGMDVTKLMLKLIERILVDEGMLSE